MKLIVQKAATDQTVYLFVQDASKSDGSGLTGLVFNSSGLVCYYVRPLGSATALTLVTQTVTGAHSDGGFVEVSSANMPGVYRLDFSDAVCATGVNSVVVMLKGATNMAPVTLEIQLASINVNDAVRLGLTALPNAAPAGGGGIVTSNDGIALVVAGGGYVLADTVLISGDATAADNAESYFDGTGYAGTGNVIPTVTTVTNLTNAPTSGDLTATMKASVNAEVDTAIADARLDELIAADSDIDGLAPPAVGSVVHEMLSKTAGSFTFDQTTDSLEAIRDNTPSAAPTAAAVADAVWDEASADHVAAGSTGERVERLDIITSGGSGGLTNARAVLLDNLDAAVTTRSSHSAADVWTSATRTLTSFGTLVADIWNSLTSGMVTAGSIGKRIVDYLTGDVFARLGAPAGASVSADIAAVKVDTAAILVDTAAIEPLVSTNLDATVSSRSTVTTAQVNAECDTALVDIHLDHLLATDYDPAAKPGTATALLNELVESDVGVSRFTANALEQAPTSGSAPTVSEIADEVQTRTIAAVTTVTNLTNAPTAGDLTATMKASVNAEMDTAIADVNLDHLVGTATGIPAVPAGTYLDQMMDDGTAVYDRTTDSLQAIRDRGDAAWTSAGDSAGVTTLLSRIPDTISLTAIAASVWNALTSGMVTVGSIGKKLADWVIGVTQTGDSFVRLGAPAGASVSADVAAIKAETASIVADTDAILLDTGTDGVVVAAASKTGYELSSTGNDAAADALLKRDWTSVSGEAARSVLNALRFLRNKWTVIGTILSVKKEDDTTEAWGGVVTTDAATEPITGSDPA